MAACLCTPFVPVKAECVSRQVSCHESGLFDNETDPLEQFPFNSIDEARRDLDMVKSDTSDVVELAVRRMRGFND